MIARYQDIGIIRKFYRLCKYYPYLFYLRCKYLYFILNGEADNLYNMSFSDLKVKPNIYRWYLSFLLTWTQSEAEIKILNRYSTISEVIDYLKSTKEI